MDFIRYPLSKIISFRTLREITGKHVLIPLYHVVSNNVIPHVSNLYGARNEKQFIKDIDFLLKEYKPVHLLDLIDYIKNKKKIKENLFHLTFDDGLAEMHSVVAPILKVKGIPATFFMNTNFIDNKDIFYRFKASLIVEYLKDNSLFKETKNEICQMLTGKKMNETRLKKKIIYTRYEKKHLLDEIANFIGMDFKKYLKNRQPYLSEYHVKDLIKQGFTIGSHSLDHPEYFNLPLSEQIRQTKESMDELVRKFGLTYRAFAFPFTDYRVSKEFFDHMYDENIPLLDISFGTAGIKDDDCERNLQRVPVEMKNMSLEDFVYQQQLFYFAKSLVGKDRIKRF